MKTPKQKTTNKEFEIFKKEARRYIEKWKITGWGVSFEMGKMGKGNVAEIRTELHSRRAIIKLSSEFSNEDYCTTESLKKYAKHEVVHLLFARLAELGYNRFSTKDELYEAEEEVVNTLMEIL